MNLLGLLAVIVLALTSTSAAAQGSDPNKLFADSKLVVRDRFSDEIVGRGPDLVLIPGLASSRATWKATAERLKATHRLHLIQVAGFAGEPARANASGEVVVPTAEALDAYLVEQKLTPAVVIGHSLGGTMTLYLAEKHPDHLKKALVVDSLPLYGLLMGGPQATHDSLEPMAAKARDAMLAAKGTTTAEKLEPQMAGMSKDQPTRHMVAEWGAASDRTVVARAMYEDIILDLRPDLPAIKAPILLLYPDYVLAGAPAGVMEKSYPALYKTAPAVRTQVVPNALHFIMLDQPQAFATALDDFLK